MTKTSIPESYALVALLSRPDASGLPPGTLQKFLSGIREVRSDELSHSGRRAAETKFCKWFCAKEQEPLRKLLAEAANEIQALLASCERVTESAEDKAKGARHAAE